MDELLLALDLLFKVGAYYPYGHRRSREITERVRAAMASLLDGASELVFELDEHTLRLQSAPLAPDEPGARSLRKLLDNSDICLLGLDADISHQDLHRLVEVLPTYWTRNTYMPLDNQPPQEDLPDTIRVHQHEFRSAPSEPPQDDQWQVTRDKIRDLLAELAGMELDPVRVSLCRSLADRFLRRADSGEAITLELMTSRLRSEQVASEFADIMTDDLQVDEVEAVHLSAQKLGRLLEVIMSTKDAEIAHESLDLLISLLNKTVPDSWVEAVRANREVGPEPANVHTRSLPELREDIDQYDPGCPLPGAIMPSRVEMLAIHMQMLKRKQTLRASRRLGEEVGKVIAAGLRGPERSILVRSAANILEDADVNVARHSLELLIDCFQDLETDSPYAFMLEVCEVIDTHGLASLWPVLVGEILRDHQNVVDEAFVPLCKHAASLPASDMERLIPSLRDQLGEAYGPTEETGFLPLRLELFGVYAAIVGSGELDEISRLIARGLELEPPPWLGLIVLPLTAGQFETHRDLYAELLAQGLADEPSTRLKNMAGRVLVSCLAELDANRSKEAWLPSSIRALGRLPVPGATELLHEIREEKWLRLFPTWPLACRRAAGGALRDLAASRAGQDGKADD